MLILRRKKNESILIGDSIRITVLESASDGVRLAIDAPRQMSILREELSGVEEENRASSAVPEYDTISKLQSVLLSGISSEQENGGSTETPSDSPKKQ